MHISARYCLHLPESPENEKVVKARGKGLDPEWVEVLNLDPCFVTSFHSRHP